MDFLNQTVAQVRELFGSMTPGGRVTAGLLLAVVLVSVGFLFQKATAGPDEYLFGGESIDRGHLPRMEAAMSAAGIEYTTEGTRIRVGRADKNAAIAAIADAGELPPEFHSLMAEALNGGGMFDHRDQKMQRLRAAREAQASLILSEFPWVDKANVIYNERQTQGLRGGRHATAAVSILPSVGEALSSHRVRIVRDFVSKACDVPVEDVAVTNLGGDAAGMDGEMSPDDYEHPGYRIRALEEQKIRSDILSQLSFIPGVRVEVNARIDDTSAQEIVETKPEGEPVSLHRVTDKSDSKHVMGGEGARVGTEANGPNGVGRDDLLARRDESTQTSNTSETSSGIGVRTTKTVTAGYSLKEAEASIVVPLGYVRDVYRQERFAVDGAYPDEIDPKQLEQTQVGLKTKIENIAQPLLPKLALGENEFKQVKVEFVAELPQPDLPEPSLASDAMAWTSRYANSIGMAGLAVFSLIMLRSMVSSSGTGKDPSGPEALSLQLDGEKLDTPLPDEDEPLRPKLKLKKADSLKDDLVDMVNTDPEAAAAILRSWINNSAA